MKTYKTLIVIILCACFSDCTKDFVVKDIKHASVVVLAPANNLSTPNNSITFWWEEMDGAEKYNLQIVKPNFTSIQQLIADTNVTGTKLRVTLNPGTYQWRIKGVNNGGSSQYTVFNLTIDTTSNLASQLIIPVAPVSNYLTGTKTISFSWNALSAANSYQFQILNYLGVVIKDTTTANTALITSLSAGGSYTWKVRASNAFSISQYNSPLSFTIDLTAPPVSVITSPAHGAMIKDTTELKWTRSSTDTRYDSLYIGLDSLFSSVISSERVYGSEIKINALNTAIPVSSAYYWWRLRSVDSVGNTSGYSNKLKFKLIP